MDVELHHTCVCLQKGIPYSGKLSREKTFANFEVL